MFRFFFFSIIAVSFLSVTNSQEVNHVYAHEFSKLTKSGKGVILDVRTAREYSRGHIENSTLISTNDPKFVEKINLLKKDSPVYVYCLTGNRSNKVANYLYRNGYTKVYNLRKGVVEWQRAGYSLVQGENPVATDDKTYSKSEFLELIQSKRVVLIDFHAPWCAPCKKMSPVVEKLEKDYKGKVLIEKLDVQANKILQDAYNVESIPGFVLFKNGKQVWKHSGMISYDELSTIMNKYLL